MCCSCEICWVWECPSIEADYWLDTFDIGLKHFFHMPVFVGKLISTQHTVWVKEIMSLVIWKTTFFCFINVLKILCMNVKYKPQVDPFLNWCWCPLSYHCHSLVFFLYTRNDHNILVFMVSLVSADKWKELRTFLAPLMEGVEGGHITSAALCQYLITKYRLVLKWVHNCLLSFIHIL